MESKPTATQSGDLKAVALTVGMAILAVVIVKAGLFLYARAWELLADRIRLGGWIPVAVGACAGYGLCYWLHRPGGGEADRS